MSKDDIYDIIIENITKEWHNSMINTSKDSWEYPQYSKKQIEKAGKIIANNNPSQDEFNNALIILNNWRSSHAYPLQIITNNLRRKNPNANIVQRLKRLDSIMGKLQRYPEMSLYKMQDLGGCRVIVDSISQVYESVNKFKSSRVRHILKKENDYIRNPKSSGYRSYHMVYQFQSDYVETYNKNILIEIQFRTTLQHIWATAVEVMGVYTKSQLKASLGDENVLRFFTLASSIFSLQENTPVCPGTSDNYNILISEMKKINNDLNIIYRLSAISVAIKNTNKKMEGKGYYLLQLMYNDNIVKVSGFKTTQVDLATKIYNEIESINKPDVDSVLVAASSFKSLRAAYPNYFADIKKFVNILKELLE